MLCQNPVRHTINVPSSLHTVVVIILVRVVVNTEVGLAPNHSIAKHCADLFSHLLPHIFFSFFLSLQHCFPPPTFLFHLHKASDSKSHTLGLPPYVSVLVFLTGIY